jgi:predicted helicase
MLHHPAYRTKYAENLKRELPRIPLLADAAAFRVLADTGAKLAELHLNYESAPEHRLRWVENKDLPFSWRVQKMKLSPDKTALKVNESLTLEGIPPEALQYRLGNRSALEWIVDQYQVKTDARSGLVSDPNREGEGENNEEYIVRLVGRVVTVSVQTVALVEELKTISLSADSESPSAVFPETQS